MNVTFDFSGQNLLVTGASSGIGRETARELLEAGATVMGIARHFPESDELTEEYPGRWVPMKADVTDLATVEEVVTAFVAKHGKLSGCVHSAGMAVLLPVNVWDHEQAKRVMDVNLWAGEALLKLLWKRKYHEVGFSHVFISSVSAQKGQKGLSIYAASKAAVESLVRTAAQELAVKGQRVNSVCLGWIETGMTRDTENDVPPSPLGSGRTEDAVGMILYLLSDRARWITGANFIIDGGYLA